MIVNVTSQHHNFAYDHYDATSVEPIRIVDPIPDSISDSVNESKLDSSSDLDYQRIIDINAMCSIDPGSHTNSEHLIYDPSYESSSNYDFNYENYPNNPGAIGKFIGNEMWNDMYLTQSFIHPSWLNDNDVSYIHQTDDIPIVPQKKRLPVFVALSNAGSIE